MKNAAASIFGAVLDRLGINYREFPCGKGAFYYCKIPSNGYTFDLQCDDDNMIRLWRFVGTAPLSKAGKRCEYRNPNYPNTAIGVEVTDEGDVSFYAEQKINPNDSGKQERITHMIEGYVSVIADMKLKLV